MKNNSPLPRTVAPLLNGIHPQVDWLRHSLGTATKLIVITAIALGLQCAGDFFSKAGMSAWIVFAFRAMEVAFFAFDALTLLSEVLPVFASRMRAAVKQFRTQDLPS